MLGCIDSTNDTHDVIKLRDELKTLTTEVNLKRKEISMMNINEEGLKKNIKHLEEIISIKVINNIFNINYIINFKINNFRKILLTILSTMQKLNTMQKKNFKKTFIKPIKNIIKS